MLSFKKNIFLTLLLLLCASTAFGYKFTFSNVTERTIIISYKLETLPQSYYQILYPDQSISHYFPNLHCFGGSILWAEVKSKDAFGRDLPFNGGLDLLDQETGEIDQELFASKLANKYAFIPMQIKVVDNETFQMTANAAQDLMEGIDRLACGTIDAVATFSVPPSPTDLLSPSLSLDDNSQKQSNKKCRFGLGKLAKGAAGLAGSSLCRDLHFLMVDTGEMGSPTPTKAGVTVSRVKKPILIAEINQGG